jgi:hypothetical protein
MRRAATILVGALTAVMMLAGVAFAHDCYVAKKPVTAGNVAVFGEGEDPIAAKPGILKRLDKGLPLGGGHIGIDFSGDGVADASVLNPGGSKGVLPDGALQSGAKKGPNGDPNGCGTGIDSFDLCMGGGDH